LSNKLLSNIFLLTISFAFFLDAINVDAIFTSHAMIREEYEGQSSEMDDYHHDEQIIFYAHSSTTENRVYQQASNSNQPVYLIDEDSVCLAAQSASNAEAALLYCRSSSVRHAALHVPLFDIYSLCKLQI
jgi:hypothetical protein